MFNHDIYATIPFFFNKKGMENPIKRITKRKMQDLDFKLLDKEQFNIDSFLEGDVLSSGMYKFVLYWESNNQQGSVQQYFFNKIEKIAASNSGIKIQFYSYDTTHGIDTKSGGKSYSIFVVLEIA